MISEISLWKALCTSFNGLGTFATGAVEAGVEVPGMPFLLTGPLEFGLDARADIGPSGRSMPARRRLRIAAGLFSRFSSDASLEADNEEVCVRLAASASFNDGNGIRPGSSPLLLGDSTPLGSLSLSLGGSMLMSAISGTCIYA